ncbi:MAG: ribonuclease HII [Actinomycetota bacterium]|nr:ribonuclease HII [Actinomycetota bacterium]
MSPKEIEALLETGPVTDEIISVFLDDPRSSVRNLAYLCLRKGKSLRENEEFFRKGNLNLLAGVDEAGRGALAGPICAAAVVFKPDTEIEGINDSKALTPKVREELYDEIVSKAEGVSVVFIDAGLIDRWGIQMSNLKAFRDALGGLSSRCEGAICDHFVPPGCPFPTFGIPKADCTFQCVAAASIVAKVERDRVMRGLDRGFKGYNFARNKGYATREHLEALAQLGPSGVHRLTFSPLRQKWEGSLLACDGKA